MLDGDCALLLVDALDQSGAAVPTFGLVAAA
jgi:hypothetical protein